MSARNKFVKVRLSPEEYADVLQRADVHGLTMCEHIRHPSGRSIDYTRDGIGRISQIQSDQLNTPRLITDAANSPVWQWDSDPFGASMPDQDPGSSGNAFVFNPRFPGQYFDKETNFHYNYYRDYDPSSGRYVQSDPIGLMGGINTYAYVGGNPISYTDPKGLLVATGIRCLTNPACRAVAAAVATAAVANAAQMCSDGVNRLRNWYAQENTNPYNAPVDMPVVVVDENGNAIPVGEGEQVRSSPNGDYQQVLGPDGRPTGVRLDRGGHRNQSDPRAQNPHSHVPDVTLPDGNPHLPIRR